MSSVNRYPILSQREQQAFKVVIGAKAKRDRLRMVLFAGLDYLATSDDPDEFRAEIAFAKELIALIDRQAAEFD